MHRNSRVHFATLFAVLTSFFGALAPAIAFDIAVSPARFELALDRTKKTQSIEIINTGDTEAAIEIDVANFDLDEANKVRILPPTEQSLDQWIAINPRRLTVPGKGRRTIRFAIRPQVKPEPGEHRAIIFLNQQQAGTFEGAELNFRIGVVVYGQVGEFDRNTHLHDVVFQNGTVGLDVENIGNAHARFKGAYAVWPTHAYPGDSAAQIAISSGLDDRKVDQPLTVPGASSASIFSETPVFPGARRTILQRVEDASAGVSKTIFLLGKLGGQPIAQSHTLN